MSGLIQHGSVRFLRQRQRIELFSPARAIGQDNLRQRGVEDWHNPVLRCDRPGWRAIALVADPSGLSGRFDAPL